MGGQRWCSGGGWGLQGLVCFPQAVVFWVLDDAPKLTPWGGRSHLLKDGGGEWEGGDDARGDGGLLGRSASPRQRLSVCWTMSPRLHPAGLASIP